MAKEIKYKIKINEKEIHLLEYEGMSFWKIKGSNCFSRDIISLIRYLNPEQILEFNYIEGAGG